MPSTLIFLLACDLADAGWYDTTISLLGDRYFESAEQGADVRQVYLAIKLKQALEQARRGDCIAALAEGPRLQPLRYEIKSFCPSEPSTP